MFKVEDYHNVPAEPVEGTPGVAIRWIVDEKRDGAPSFAMRILEVQPGYATPHHTHWQEHGNYILEGTGFVRYGDETRRVKPGDAVFVPANAKHQYVNDGGSVLRFICTIPLPWVRAALEGRPGEAGPTKRTC
jgi:quercetin dioxygenase-like cupin family protein